MSFARYQTLATLVSSTLASLGLAAPTTIVGSSDRTAEQMVSLANDLGQFLLNEGDWQMLDEDLTITTVIGDATYPLPADFNGFVQDAQWNRTTRLPAIGSLTEQEWQMLKARQLAGTTFTMLFRVVDDEVEFYDTPSTVQTIVLPYKSRGWVRSAANVRKDSATANDDVILYDPLMFRLGLRLFWMESKQFDTTTAKAAFKSALDAAKSKDKPARTLTLNSNASYPYLGVINIPDTNYGS